jgi:2'-hydroxyisoflavone reductase
MKLLVLGGTVFLGRHVVAAAVETGHDVTIFTRGRHEDGVPASVERLHGDRDGDLGALAGRRWDAVIDTSGQLPSAARAAAELVSGSVEHYTFVSTIAAYAGFPSVVGLDEYAPLATLPEGAGTRVTPATVGPLKAACERALAAVLGDRVLIVRAGLLAGPHDPSDRFTYWPRRVARGGEVLAPDRPAMPVQLIDARDLARWIVDGAEARRTGAFNATGPAEPLTMEQLLEACRAVTGADARFTWVDESFLLASGVKPRMDLPLWMPDGRGAATADCRRALAAGLRLRPLHETVRDTLAWDAARPPEAPRRAGIAPGREAELLAAWHQQHVAALTSPR